MNNVLNSSNKSDYYIGMSIPSRQSEFTPNVIVSSETILDYDEYNPPPRQHPSKQRQRRAINDKSHNNNGRGVYDIKEEDEEEEEDSISEEEDYEENEEDDDILENDSYEYDDDSSDNIKHHISNKTNNTNVTYKQSHHTNSSNTPINNATPIGGMNTSIDEDNEYTQIQALQEQLQQQQRQLILQSHQLKQLKTQIKNQNDNDVAIPPVPPPPIPPIPNNVNVNVMPNMPNIPIPIPVPQIPVVVPNIPLQQYHFDDNDRDNEPIIIEQSHTQPIQQIQPIQHGHGTFSSDSDDPMSNSPFPNSLTFDEQHHYQHQHQQHMQQQSNPNMNMNVNNPNLNIPKNQIRTIHSVEHGSFRQKQMKNNNNIKQLRSPRTPKNPFSRNNSRQNNGNINQENINAISPRKKATINDIHPPNVFNNNVNVMHKRSNSGSSHKSSRSKSKKKLSQKRKARTEISMEPIIPPHNHVHNIHESPHGTGNVSPTKSSHSSKRRSNRSNRSNKSNTHNSHSHHSSIHNNNNNNINVNNHSSPRKQSRDKSHRKSNRQQLIEREREREREQEPPIDPNVKLNRKQLNKIYETTSNKRTVDKQREMQLQLQHQQYKSPPISIGNSPPLSPHSTHEANIYSDDDCDIHSSHSYSNGTTGINHKLADIPLPSIYYSSEATDINAMADHKISSNVVDLFLDPLKEIEFTADNLDKHNKQCEANKLKAGLNGKNKLNKYHYHQHQHQHLHHHHHYPTSSNGNGTPLFNNTLSVASTDSAIMTRIFHPVNRMRSVFQDKTQKNKPNLPINPESQYSTAAALDPLDELDNMDVLNNYDKHKELGNGTDAFVYEVVDRRDKSHVAMKLTKRKSGRYKTEIHLLHQLRTCPYVVKLLNCLENDNVYVLILEHAPMSLENLLLQRCTKHPMQERVAKTILSQILKGIRAIHNLGFVHKDIKPENILIFANRSERKLIAKVADFGFATRVAPPLGIEQLPKEKYIEFQKHVRDRCGTPGFWPPELVTSLCELKHAFKMDVFSAGVTLYRMLCNEMPFGIFESWKYTTDHRDGQKKLCKVKPNWKVISWIQSDNKYTPVLSSRKLSDCVKELLRTMLRIRPEQRANVDSCLIHQFFNYKSQKSQKSHSQNTHKKKKRSNHSNSNISNHGHGHGKYNRISNNKMKAKG